MNGNWLMANGTLQTAAAAAREHLYLAPRFAWCGVVLGALAFAGCTAESTRVALETQRRADTVAQAVFDRQHEALRVLLYRDLARRLAQAGDASAGGAGGGLNDAQRTVLSEAWNERDLIEFWAVQFERMKALRLMGVDAKLYSDQSIIDLLVKSLEAKADRAKEGVASYVGREVVSSE